MTPQAFLSRLSPSHTATALQAITNVHLGKVNGTPRHWLGKPTLHPCPNCQREANEVCAPISSRPYGKPCNARVRLSQALFSLWHEIVKPTLSS